MVRLVLPIAAWLLSSAIVSGQTVGPVEEQRIDLVLASGARCELRLVLQRDHVAHAARIADAARESLDLYSEWFAPYPLDHLTIVDLPWQAPAPEPSQPGEVWIRARWLQPERSLTLESQVARGIARQWWGESVRMPARFLADGLAEYAQSRVVERIFDRRHQRMSYSLQELRLFDGFVPWAIRALRLDRQTSGIGRPLLRRNPLVDANSGSPEAVRAAQTAKAAAAFATLERYIGWPALQRGLSAAARSFAGRTMSPEQFYATVGAAADRDLSWFFEQAFGRPALFDFAVTDLSSVPGEGADCATAACYRTTVVVSRLGEGLFTGTSLLPVGDFEAGRAIEVKLTFGDGSEVVEHWDGRRPSKTLVYHGPAPAVAAVVDPANKLLLDVNRLNNFRTLASPDPVAVLPWSARWTIWLQDLVLSYAFLF